MADNRNCIYIDQNVCIHEGGEAERLLAAANPRFLSPVDEEGIAAVNEQRWSEAQEYERNTWLKIRRFARSDRNEDHRRRFLDYDVIRGRHFEHAIELGCGPFTNLRYILQCCQIDEVHLLDPLATDYLGHPFCTYRDRRIGGLRNGVKQWRAVRHPAVYGRTLANYLRIGGHAGRPIQLHASKIEEFRTDRQFDLVVMINVLEHCQDAVSVFKSVLAMLAPGGCLIFADRLYNSTEIERLSTRLYDAGHPLRVDGTLIDKFLAQHFLTRYRCDERVDYSFRGLESTHIECYFVGQDNRPNAD